MELDYDPDVYNEVITTLKQMYEGYEDYYYDLLYSLQPWELILFYEQVNYILNNPKTTSQTYTRRMHQSCLMPITRSIELS